MKRAPRRLFALLVLFACLPLAAQDGLPGLTEPEAAAETEPAADAREPISPEADPALDDEIRRRLEEIYSVIGALDGVEVEVEAGVVRLSGEVLGAERAAQARELAGQIRGVVAVEDDLTEVRDLDRRLAPAWSNLRDRVMGWIAMLPLLGVALAVFLAFWFLARWLGGRQRVFRRLTRNQFLQELARQVVRAAVIVVGGLLALEILDATALVGAVLGTAGVVGLALGFAFRDTAENYIASILLSIRQPFAPNDHVVVEGHEGRVARLTSRATILLTLDGNHVRIPNSQVFKGVIVNYTRNPQRRFTVEVGVGTDEVLTDVLDVGVRTLEDMPGVLDTPPPVGRIRQLGDSNVLVHLHGWVDQRDTDFRKVRSEAVRRVKEAYDRAGFFMPEPIYRVKAEWVEGATPTRTPPNSKTEGAEPPKRERPAAPGREPLDADVDLSPDRHLDRQVAEDRAAARTEDLLDPQAPLE